METELKFQVPRCHRQALHQAVATASAVTTRLQAVYVDTPGRQLAAAGLALRLRKEGRVWVQTLKGRGDGLMQRLEHEVLLPAQRGMPTLDPQRHAGTPAGHKLQAVLAGGAPLQPVYRTDIQRLHRRVRHGGAVIELAYDRGHIVAGEQRVVVDEIEFELISGPATALPALAARWAQRFGLWWDVRTKSERGFRLALGLVQVPAVHAEATRMPTGAGTAEAWRAMLHAALAQALPNAAEVAGGNGTPEHLHQLRVGLRRLRSALRVFAAWAPDPAEALALQAAWRQPFARLGAARDLDVLAQAWRPRLAGLQAPGFVWPVPADDAAPDAVVREPVFTALLLRSLALSLAPGARGPRDSAAPHLGAQAAALWQALWRRARRDAKGFALASPAQQHGLRKRLKRLRYALDFVAPVMRARPSAAWQALLRDALDALGALNDLQQAQAIFSAHASQVPQAWFAAGLAAGLREAAVQRAAASLARWREADLR